MVALPDQLVDPFQSRLAASSRTKSMAWFREVAFTDRLDHVHHRLHDPITNRGNAQRSGLVRARLREVCAFDRRGFVLTGLQLVRQFPNRFGKLPRPVVGCLMIDPRGPVVLRDLLKRRRQISFRVNFTLPASTTDSTDPCFCPRGRTFHAWPRGVYNISTRRGRAHSAPRGVELTAMSVSVVCLKLHQQSARFPGPFRSERRTGFGV